ncbi:hypothetical protein OSTOST_20214, partial [Ostertagia ostertagi]
EFQSCDSSKAHQTPSPTGIPVKVTGETPRALPDLDVVDPYSEDRRIAMRQLYEDYEVSVPDEEKITPKVRYRPASPMPSREPIIIQQFAQRFPQPLPEIEDNLKRIYRYADETSVLGKRRHFAAPLPSTTTSPSTMPTTTLPSTMSVEDTTVSPASSTLASKVPKGRKHGMKLLAPAENTEDNTASIARRFHEQEPEYDTEEILAELKAMTSEPVTTTTATTTSTSVTRKKSKTDLEDQRDKLQVRITEKKKQLAEAMQSSTASAPLSLKANRHDLLRDVWPPEKKHEKMSSSICDCWFCRGVDDE